MLLGLFRRQDADDRHHAPILVIENVTVINEVADVRSAEIELRGDARVWMLYIAVLQCVRTRHHVDRVDEELRSNARLFFVLAESEQADARERYGPQLPATLKELFLPTQTNETPLSIYGSLAFGYSKIIGNAATAANGAGRPPTPGGFYFGEFTPDFLLKLNDWIFLEAEIGINSSGAVSSGSFAQADFFVNDWLTVIAGRFVAPIGFCEVT